MFISWGSHGALAQVGESEVMHCTGCGQDSYWSTMVSYTVRHVYWLFRWTSDRNYYRMCGNCLGTEHLDERQIPAPAVKAAIPFMDRRGWTIGAGIIASIFGLGSIAAAQDASENSAFVQAPRVGDIYEADIAQIVEKPEKPRMYSAMRVVDVRPEGVEVEIADLYYEDLRGVDRDLREGLAARPGYFRDDHIVFPAAALRQMQADGVIIDVER